MPQNAESLVCRSNQANQSEPGFLKEVIQRSGVNASLCWHCLSCGGGCPFSEDMDIGLKMLSKRKLDLIPNKVKNLNQV